jgi:hypothetical protein
MKSILTSVLAGLFALSCISVPKETVTLSEKMLEETATLQTAHEAVTSRFYAGLRQQVDDFLTNVWIPSFLSKAVQNAQVQQRMGDAVTAANISSADITAKINADTTLTTAEKTVIANALTKAAVGGRAQLGQVMIDFGTEATRQIAKQRKAMVDPIDQQEQLALDNIRQSYAQLQAEQAAIKGYLASAVNVREQEDEALQRLGILKQRDQALKAAAAASDTAAKLLTDVEKANDFINNINAANAKLKGGTQ